VVKRVDQYRGRCGGLGELPPAGMAAVELSILTGAGRETAPIVVRDDSAKLAGSELPVVLADGWGAVLSVCDHRASSLAKYVEAREACENGTLSLVRVFKTKAKDIDVRAGVLAFANDVDFGRRFPSIRAAGEIELADEAELPGLEADLAKIALLGQDADKASAAGESLARAVGSRGAALVRSAPLRAALAKRDADLVPALRAIGDAKGTVAKSLSPSALAGLVQRGARSAFADTNAAGGVEPGALGPAWSLDTRALLPRAMAAYDGAMDDAVKLAAKKKPDAGDAKRAKTSAKEHASSCGVAMKQARAAEQSMIACGFAIQACDAGRVASLIKEQDAAFASAQKARRELDLAMTGPGYAVRTEIAAAATAAGCLEPWW
jgi:hypothetical protein